MVSRYVDVFKGAKDLLTKSFVYQNKVEYKSTTSNGVTFTAETALGKPGTAGSASLKAEFLAGRVKVDSLKIGTDMKVTGEFSMPDAFPGTKVTFKATDGSRVVGPNAISAALGAEYKHDFGTYTVDVDAITYGMESTAVVSFNKFLFGGCVKANFGKEDSSSPLTDYGVMVGYKAKDFTAAVQTEKQFTDVAASWHQAVSPELTAAAIAKFPAKFAPATSPFKVEFGLAYRAAADTIVTAKVNEAGKVGLSYAQQVSPLTKLTLATELDAQHIASDDHKFGIVLNVTH